MEIFLSSKSPRRYNLLKQIGLEFKTIQIDAEETTSQNLTPADLAIFNARQKVLKAVLFLRNGLNQNNALDLDYVVIGADTIVVCKDENIFGKPKNEQEAVLMLSELSGKEHKVITGVALAYADKVWSDFAQTIVGIRALTLAEIENYVRTGEPLDKAGAYGIQERGILLVEYINGCYTNVVGLPLLTLFELFKKAGVSPPCLWTNC